MNGGSDGGALVQAIVGACLSIAFVAVIIVALVGLAAWAWSAPCPDCRRRRGRHRAGCPRLPEPGAARNTADTVLLCQAQHVGGIESGCWLWKCMVWPCAYTGEHGTHDNALVSIDTHFGQRHPGVPLLVWRPKTVPR